MMPFLFSLIICAGWSAKNFHLVDYIWAIASRIGFSRESRTVHVNVAQDIHRRDERPEYRLQLCHQHRSATGSLIHLEKTVHETLSPGKDMLSLD